MNQLYASSTTVRALGAQQARAVLVFPRIVKGDFLLGAQHREGALLMGGRTVGFYNTVAVSYGL